MAAGPRVTRKSEGKIKNTSGKDELDSGLRRLLLYFLTTLSSQGVGMNSQGFRDTRAKLLRLNQYGDQIAHAVHVGALRKIPPGIGAGAPRALLQHDDSQFIADFRLSPVQFFAVRAVAWSRLWPASMQMTSRSSTSGKPRRIAPAAWRSFSPARNRAAESPGPRP